MPLKLLPSDCHPGKTQDIPVEFGQNLPFFLSMFYSIGDVTFATVD